MCVWLTTPGMHSSAAVEVHVVVLSEVSQHEEVCVHGLAFQVQVLSMCRSKSWNVTLPHSVLTT